MLRARQKLAKYRIISRIASGPLADVYKAFDTIHKTRVALKIPKMSSGLTIVFVRVGECLWSPVDGKPKAGSELARVRNIRERPEVGLLLDEYTEDWKRLWWIRIDANARVVRPEAPNEAPGSGSGAGS